MALCSPLMSTASNFKSIHKWSEKAGLLSVFLRLLFYTAFLCGAENAHAATNSVARTAHVAPRSQAESDHFSGHIPKLIYLPHLASINGSKAQVTGLFNTFIITPL